MTLDTIINGNTDTFLQFFFLLGSATVTQALFGTTDSSNTAMENFEHVLK